MYSYCPFILTMENLKKNCNVNNLSFVLNDVSHSSHGNYGGYGYGNYGKYGYGKYGYGGYGIYGSYGYTYGDNTSNKKKSFYRLQKLRIYRKFKRIINK